MAALPPQRLENVGECSAAHAGKLLYHEQTLEITPQSTFAPLFPERVRNTHDERHSDRAEH